MHRPFSLAKNEINIFNAVFQRGRQHTGMLAVHLEKHDERLLPLASVSLCRDCCRDSKFNWIDGLICTQDHRACKTYKGKSRLDLHGKTSHLFSKNNTLTTYVIINPCSLDGH